MCNRVVSVVMSDNGIASWTILAHEIAHNFGVDHDPGVGCPNFAHIMTTTISGGRYWSNCSRVRFNKKFEQNSYSCLKDAPQALPLPTISPSRQGRPLGVLFDKKRQCQMASSNSDATYCSYHNPKDCILQCSTVSDPNYCYGSLLPLLDGSRCGVRNWCVESRCVDDGSPLIHGGWSSWSDVSACTRSCGRGIKYRSRTCTNPRPQNGGSTCQGSAKSDIEVCNLQPCPTNLRHTLCHQRRGDQYWWHPYGNPCYLYCRFGSLLKGTDNIPDGDPCYPNSDDKFDVCFGGKCTLVGCDLKIGSLAKFDRCRVCGGDGTSCEHVNGSYTKEHTLQGMDNADLVVMLPIGTINVTIKEREKSWNLIGLTRMNGSFLYSVPTTLKTVKEAGMNIIIRGSNRRNLDNIYIPGPTTEPLRAVYVYVKGGNKGIDFEFWKKKMTVGLTPSSTASPTQVTRTLSTKPLTQATIPTEPAEPKYLWTIGNWTACSKTCGKGTQFRLVECALAGAQTVVDHKLCTGNEPVANRDCNIISCPEWKPMPWSKCSTSCNKGVKTRIIECIEKDENDKEVVVNDDKCQNMDKPPTVMSCNKDTPCVNPPSSPLSIGCFKVTKKVLKKAEMLSDLTSSVNWKNTDAVVAKCAELAKNKAFTHFALGENGKCYSGKGLAKNYFKAKVSMKKKPDCQNGVGKRRAIYVYRLDIVPEHQSIGCYEPKAFSGRYASLRSMPDWYNITMVTIKQCASIAYDMGRNYFGIRSYGDCYSAPDNTVENRLKNLAHSNACWEGVGTVKADFIYHCEKDVV